ncbi:hypothetical protein AGOR_G00029810 [Albula goreensis]|uniref:non-specific serine/threonine protein kinase n=1 Tax=Albula goreensis TaxID=1534307 RepID=A0A8T3E2G0_9TELE|nr:hypothetical protein AGOR_G00029810 [Albula goreensis]
MHSKKWQALLRRVSLSQKFIIMGNEQSILKQHGYTLLGEDGQRDFRKEVWVKCNADGKQYIIKPINMNYLNKRVISMEEIKTRIKTLQTVKHPNIVNYKETFEDGDTLYVVMEYSKGNLSQTIDRQGKALFKEYKILDWFAQICMALKYIHDREILHKDIKPQNIFLTEGGVIRLGGLENAEVLGGIGRKSVLQASGYRKPNYESPEILEGHPHDENSDIWSLGCVLYELCMLEGAYSAATKNELMIKINGSPPRISDHFSHDLCDLGSELLCMLPTQRPTVSDILGKPFIIQCLLKKFMMTVDELQVKVNELKEIIAHMERVHYGTTAGSLAGGVMGAAGGITSIVGLILAPFTLGASLIVTGVGIGVATAGGVTGAASNITNMVKQSADRNSIQAILNECQEKMDLSVTCLQNISDGINTLKEARSIDSVGLAPSRTKQAAVRAGRGMAGVGELVRLVRVATIGRVAAQVARTVRVAEAATGVLAGLFVALDIYFIAQDSREIHAMRQGNTESPHGSFTNTSKRSNNRKSDTRKFIEQMKEAAASLQSCVNELRVAIPELPQEDSYDI